MKEKAKITVAVLVDVPLKDAWESFIGEDCVVHWNFASDDWHCPWARNDFRVGGEFVYRMEARDGSFGFDFEGTYQAIEDRKRIAYVMGDDRRVELSFTQDGDSTRVVETFEAEGQNSLELQRQGWQAILDNYKKFAESRKKANCE